MSWADLAWLRSLTRLPLLLKGMHAPSRSSSRVCMPPGSRSYCMPSVVLLPNVVSAPQAHHPRHLTLSSFGEIWSFIRGGGRRSGDHRTWFPPRHPVRRRRAAGLSERASGRCPPGWNPPDPGRFKESGEVVAHDHGYKTAGSSKTHGVLAIRWVQKSASADHYCGNGSHRCQGQVYPLS